MPRTRSPRALMRVFGSLSNRIFLASALLAALSIGAALFFVRARLTAETQQALDHDLQTAANIADQQQAALFDTFTRSARLLADLPRFKAAVDTGDAPTVQPIAEEYLRELGANLLQVHDRRGARLATVGGDIHGVLRVVEVPIRVDQDIDFGRFQDTNAVKVGVEFIDNADLLPKGRFGKSACNL